MEKCDIETSLECFGDDYEELFKRAVIEDWTDEHLLDVWNEIKSEKQNEFYLECLKKI